MKSGALGDVLLRGTPKIINESETIEEAYDFGRLKNIWFPERRSLVLIYPNNTYDFVKLYLKYLVSDHVLIVMPSHIPLLARQQFEGIYKPNVIVDGLRPDLGEPESVFMDAHTYRCANPEHNLHPKLKMLAATSGSTGSPKQAKLSHDNYIALLRQAQVFPHADGDVSILATNLSFVQVSGVLCLRLYHGATIVPCKYELCTPGYWDTMRRFQVNTFVGMPIRLEQIVANEFRDLAGLKLRRISNGAGKLRNEVWRRLVEYCDAHGIYFVNTYGLTECTGQTTFLDPKYNMSKIGSIGKGLPETELSISEDGELLVKSPSVFGGYAVNLTDLSSFEQIEKLHTGDLARVDEDGFYYLIGRTKRLIKFPGSRVMLDDFESQLSNTLHVPVYCTGISNDFLLVVTTGPALDRQQIEAALSSLSPMIRRHIRLRRMDKIAETSRGKVDYQSILDLESQGLLKEL